MKPFEALRGKARTGTALDNPVLRIEGRVTLVDGLLAAAVLLGLAVNAAVGWWWADPVVGYVLAGYAATEARQLLRPLTHRARPRRPPSGMGAGAESHRP